LHPPLTLRAISKHSTRVTATHVIGSARAKAVRRVAAIPAELSLRIGTFGIRIGSSEKAERSAPSQGGYMFKGTIPVGAKVTATLTLDPKAQGSAFLAIAWSAGGSTGAQDSCTVAQAGFGEVTVTPTESSLLRVFVDMNDDSDRGELQVSPATPATPIQGDTTWTYSVE
jgi:hypothetical protein